MTANSHVDHEGPERQALRSAVTRSRGQFGPWHETLLRRSPSTLRRYLRLVDRVEADGSLEPWLVQLIWVATDAVLTHLYPRGVGIHAKRALQAGAAPAQVFETLEIAALCGTRAIEVGLAILEPLLAGEGPPPRASPAAGDPALARYEALFGSAPNWLRRTFELDPEFGAAWVDLVFAPAGPTSLELKSRLLLCFAVAVCPAVLDQAGASHYALSALAAGATPRELYAVLKTVSVLSVHSLSVGAPAIEEQLAATDAED
jgi:alkylhydroperoxidase/carboxymuconolactone decarboxylase family protein YurZ